jgi:hypothetical protein
VVAGPLLAATLTLWLAHTPAPESLRLATFSALALLAVGGVLSDLVHTRCVSAPTQLRASVLAAGSTACVPAAGLGLWCVVVTVGHLHGRRRAALTTRARAHVPTLLSLVALAPAAGSLPDAFRDVVRVRVTHDLTRSTALVPPAVAFPALAFVLLLALPLRWRGGTTALALTLGAILLEGTQGSLVPAPARAALLVGGACGWIWLAGSAPGGRPAVARVLVGATALTILALCGDTLIQAVVGTRDRTPPRRGVLDLVGHGMLAPGDVVVVHDGATMTGLRARRHAWGDRPDVTLLAGLELSDTDLLEEARGWAASRRRVLSDSFTMGGRWDATWAVDSGPLAWFVGPVEGPLQWVDVHPRSDDTPAAQMRARWDRLHLERVRFRRTRGDLEAALAALPPAVLRHTAVPAAGGDPLRRLGPGDAARTELSPPPVVPAPGTLAAEAGDLLLATGHAEEGARLLLQADTQGHPDALVALLRWHLRAGRGTAARATARHLASRAEARPELVRLLQELAVAGQIPEAELLRDALRQSAGPTAEELAARIALLRARLPAGDSGGRETLR